MVLPKARQHQPLSQSQQQALAQQYAAQIQTAFTAAIAAAGLLIAQWAAGTLTVTAAVLAGMIVAEIRKRLQRVLMWLWKAAWKAAVADAPAADRKALKAALEAFLATVGENWAFLIASTRSGDLLKAITDALAAGDPEAVTALLHDLLGVDMRPDLIAITEVMRAWNAALLAAMKLAGVAYKTWQTMRDGKVCARCLANQNAGPIPLDATFPSGDKAPGAHPRCRCYLAPWTPPANGSRAPAGTAKVLRRQVDTNGQEFWGDAPPLEANAAGGGATGPYPHRADGAPQEDIPGGVPGATAGGSHRAGTSPVCSLTSCHWNPGMTGRGEARRAQGAPRMLSPRPTWTDGGPDPTATAASRPR